jgi:hypothetical protein
MMAGIFSTTWYMYYYLNGGALIPHPRRNETAPAATLVDVIVQLVPACIYLGVFTVIMSYATLELFRRRFDGPPGCTMQRMAAAAYTVYLLHPLVLNSVIYSWLVLMNRRILPERKSTVRIIFPNNSDISSSDFGDDYLVAAGFVYTATLTNCIVWPVAWALQRFPVLRDVL